MIVKEIFFSIQGESRSTGYPTVFIRLTGCNLRCVYCDTKYSYDGGKPMKVHEIIAHIRQFNCQRVCITGGEPLLQKKELRTLISELAKNGYSISVETSGSLPISGLPKSASYIVDIKTPSSGMQDHNHLENLALLTAKDELKFVVGNQSDLDFTDEIINTHKITCPIIISPIWEMEDKWIVTNWLLKKNYPQVRLGIQIHKILNVQ